MTISGTVNKTAILLAIVMVAALWPWRIFFDCGNPAAVMPWVLIGLVGGLITGADHDLQERVGARHVADLRRL